MNMAGDVKRKDLDLPEKWALHDGFSSLISKAAGICHCNTNLVL